MTNREEVIFEWLKEHTYGDVLNSRLVDHFSSKTGCRVKTMPFGANKCPDLSKCLGEMHKQKILKRSPCGLGDLGGHMGFPKWVYVYAIR